MLGYMLRKHQAVSRDDGSTWPALINLAEWDQLQNALKRQSAAPRRTQTPSMLLGVAM